MNLHFLRVFLLDIEFWVDSLVPVGSGLPVSDKKKKNLQSAESVFPHR